MIGRPASSLRGSEGSAGVGRMTPATRSRAARMSSIATRRWSPPRGGGRGGGGAKEARMPRTKAASPREALEAEETATTKLKKKAYEEELARLQLELIKL